MNASDLKPEDFADFLDELPTIRCGEGGCNSCDLAYHRSCTTILALPDMQEPKTNWDADTDLDIRVSFAEDDDPYAVLGGEA